ncbi:YdcF family protein [Nostoc sp. CENA67]|uniref:YdcF family protein n=1 Tax=Amazonocrinis nigriterrae CENA67 TaxID=2794033 RepID=A0A8J7LBY6_9NOST|nr:YdcF family protein [Amazonocrinis nigriterrae CENA67]
MRLIKRQEIWTFTAQGWVVFLVTITALMFFAITNLHPFLAVTSRVKAADILVVDGWLSDYEVKQAAAEFQGGFYRQIITLGTSVEQGFYLSEYKNYADITAATLNKLGIPKEKLIAVYIPTVVRNRTHESAVALLQWISKFNLPIKSINLLTFDAHARRSWMIFKKVFYPQIEVGIIAAKPLLYDSNNWWKTSEGVRVTMSETIAYVYALLVSWKT